MNTIAEIEHAAYETAAQQFARLQHLSPNEKAGLRAKLREYIRTLSVCGERDPDKMAADAVALVRQFAQITRSQETAAVP